MNSDHYTTEAVFIEIMDVNFSNHKVQQANNVAKCRRSRC
jgi:hypothetical protein